MKEENSYWVDSNNNKWSKSLYTKEQAERYSDSLFNCEDCVNCSFCRFCSDCDSCSFCSDCDSCSYCRYCDSCSYCGYCGYFKTNPQRITSYKLGSRESQTTYYWTKEHEQVVCGCYKGTLDEFEAKVKEVYGTRKKHGKEYLRWIKSVKTYKELVK